MTKKNEIKPIELDKTRRMDLAQTTLIEDLRQIIEQARGRVAATANYELTMMYWHIGERINREVLGNQRADYGKQIVSAVSTQLQAEYGKKGFSATTLKYTRFFYELYAPLFANRLQAVDESANLPVSNSLMSYRTNCPQKLRLRKV